MHKIHSWCVCFGVCQLQQRSHSEADCAACVPTLWSKTGSKALKLSNMGLYASLCIASSPHSCNFQFWAPAEWPSEDGRTPKVLANRNISRSVKICFKRDQSFSPESKVQKDTLSSKCQSADVSFHFSHEGEKFLFEHQVTETFFITDGGKNGDKKVNNMIKL